MSKLFKSKNPPKPYKDLGKQANDLLNKGFPSGDNFDWKIDSTIPVKDNVNFTGSLTKKQEGISGGESSIKIPVFQGDLTAKVDLDRNIKLEFNKKNAAKGFDVNSEVAVDVSKGFQDLKLKVGGDYKRQWVTASSSLSGTVTNLSTVSSNTSFVLGNPDLALGVETDVNATKFDFKTLNIAASYSPTEVSAVTAFYKNKRDPKKEVQQLGANFYTKVSASDLKGLSVAGEVLYVLNEGVSVSAGAIYSPDSSSTLKARINNNGLLGLAYTQRVGSAASASAAVDVNLFNSPRDVRYGFKLSLAS